MENTGQRSKRARGTGSIFRQPGSRFWWVAYQLDGKPVRESSRTERKWEAQNMLKDRLLQAQGGDFLGPKIDKILVEELAEALLADYRVNEKSIEWAGRCWTKHLEPHFGKMRAAAVGTDALNRYIEARRGKGAANGTINRELSLLQRAFTLAYEAQPRKVARPLRFHRLAESKPRSGFVEDAQYRTLCDKATGKVWFRLLLALGYSYGFRKGELLEMKVRQVDLLGRTLRLDPGTTKNGEGRTVPLTEECYVLLVEAVRGKQAVDHVFTRPGGEPVSDFRGAWDALVKSANMPELLFHDLRRSAVRNMVRRGVPERVAMAISGHKTRSVFDRYNIVSEADLAEAARRIEGSTHSSYIVRPVEALGLGEASAPKPS